MKKGPLYEKRCRGCKQDSEFKIVKDTSGGIVKTCKKCGDETLFL